ncbi:MAG: hypothetical protein JWL69_25 [Phycisphaerales bacterium]|nr:hypothetical protein [Phycisphaerales bacterium]
MAFFWSAFVLVLTGQYREILPEPARPEYSETDNYAADETATKIALSTPRLAAPLMPVSGTVADAGDSNQSRSTASLSIFGSSGRRQLNLSELINRNRSKQQ